MEVLARPCEAVRQCDAWQSLSGGCDELLFRYLRKGPVSDKKIQLVATSNGTEIEYPSLKDGTLQSQTFTSLDFLAALSAAIPNKWEQNTRFCGAYSARTRGVKKAALLAASAASPANEDHLDTLLPLPEEPPQPASSSWARCMKKIFELDPLACPSCAALGATSQLKIVAFIVDPYQIDRITKACGRPLQRAPPRLRFRSPIAA